MLRLAHLVSDEQARLIRKARELLSGLAQLPFVRGGDPLPCSAHLSPLLRDNRDHYANLGMMQPDGEVICSALPIPDVSTVVAPSIRHAIKTCDVVIGPYEIDRRTGQAVLTLAKPVLDTTGRAQAVVFAELHLDWIKRLLSEAQLPQGSALHVIAQDGMILICEPDRIRWVGQSALGTPSFRTILEQGREGMAEAIGLDGLLRLLGYMPFFTSLETGNTYVVAAAPVVAAFAAFKRTMARQLVGLGLLVALATLRLGL